MATIILSALHCLQILLLVIKAIGATYPVDFKVTLDVERLNSGRYRKFLTEFRGQLAKGGQHSGTVPILPTFSDDPHLFDVVLTTRNHQVTVRGRRNDVYVQGYLMQTPSRWMEFKEQRKDIKPRHMVDPNSEFLSFGDKYYQMETEIFPTTVMSFSFTKAHLNDAVNRLATSTDDKERAKSLIFMFQMLSEAARFVDVANFFRNNLFTRQHIPLWMRHMQNDWGKYSKAVQCSDAYPNYKFTKVVINNIEYRTVAELRTIFGIMLKEVNILNPTTCGIKKLHFEDEDGAAAALLSANISAEDGYHVKRMFVSYN